MEENHDFSQMSSDEIWEVLPNLTGRDRGFALLSLANHAWGHHEIDQLMPLAMEAKDLFTNTGDKRELSIAYGLIGNAHAHNHDHEAALKSFNKALGNTDALTGSSELGSIYRNLATSLGLLKKFDEAAANYELARIAYIDCDDFNEAVGVTDELAMMFLDLGKREEAVALLNDAQYWYTGVAEPLAIMELYMTLAVAHIQMRQPEPALEATKVARALSKTCNCPRCPIRIQIRLAECYTAAKDFDSALAALDEAQSLATASGRKFYVALALRLRATIARHTDPALARELAVEACTINRVMNDRLSHTYGEYLIGKILLDEGNVEDAAEALSTVVDDLIVHNRPTAAGRANIKLAQAKLELGNPAAALARLNGENNCLENLTMPWEIYNFKTTKLKAEFLCKKLDEAKATACDLIISIDPEESPSHLAIAHEYLARITVNTHPLESDRSASLSMAYYAAAGMFDDVQRIATEFFLSQMNTLRAIAEDNDRRAASTSQALTDAFNARKTSLEDLVELDAKLLGLDSEPDTKSA